MTHRPKSKAGQEIERIKNLSAFTVRGYKEKKKLNQHCVEYRFYDASVLWIYITKSNAWAYKFGVESIKHPLKVTKQEIDSDNALEL